MFGRKPFNLLNYLLILSIVVILTTPIAADWPPQEGDDLSLPVNWPNDPGYASEWNLWSFMPTEWVDNVSAYEASIGTGFHADRAWQYTIGDPKVIIAVLDSGIRWRERDLVNKYYLNRAELPVPDVACGVNAIDPHDANGDGIFNVQDYTTATGNEQPNAATICHSGLTDDNANGILDPQDLINTYSDGVDDDANGWIDDISGWDAFQNDNDPNDDTDFGHGTGEARDSAAETNNALGSVGVCPSCLILNVRVGDSFVADSNDFAVGVVFSVDSGAALVQEALGTINGSKAMVEAIDYAWQQNVAMVASAADENSFHANLPGSVNHTIYVHANRHDRASRENSTTFLAFNNCTNYGAQLVLSTPGNSCSSEAVGKTSGIVGLMYAAALDAVDNGVNITPPRGSLAPTDQFGIRLLDGEEIKQLLIETVDDIYDPADATDPDKYVTYVGWEKRFGYGRTNAGNAVEEILAGRIPPVVDVQGPDWFQPVFPEQTPSIDIVGEIRYRPELFDSYDYVVEWAPGIEPVSADWTTLSSGTGETTSIDGTLATWDISSLEINNPDMPAPDISVNRYMVTVRVRVTLNSTDSERDGTTGQIRRAFHIVRDPDLREGFPVKLNASAEGSPKLSDIDDDGKLELIVADSAGYVYVYNEQGQARTGWPVQLHTIEQLDSNNPANHISSAGFGPGGVSLDTSVGVMGAPAIGDLDGDGSDGKSIIIATLDGAVYAFAPDGTIRNGFPVEIDPSKSENTDKLTTLDKAIFAAPVLYDLDSDGDLEIIAGANDGHLYAWQHNGSLLSGFPVELTDNTMGDDQRRARITATPAVGDITGDGNPEIVVGTNEYYDGQGRLYAVKADGTYLDGFPVNVGTQNILPYVGIGLPNSPTLADFDGDGVLDIAHAGIAQVPSMVRGNGTLVGTVDNLQYGENSNSEDAPSITAVSSGAVGDLNNDGTLDLVWGGAGLGFAEAFAGAGVRVDFDHQVGAWDTSTGQYLKGFPQRADDHQFFMVPAIADISGDKYPEVISGSGGYYVRAWNHEGASPEGWPKFTGGWITGSPAVGDADGNGTLEVAAGTREGYLFLWNTQGSADGRVDSASFHHDDQNTGNHAHPLPFGTTKASSGDGGCCDATGTLPVSTLVLCFGLALLFLRKHSRV